MDWGIVASVLVALSLFAFGLATLGLMMFAVMGKGMRDDIESGRPPKCSMPGCPFHDGIEDAPKADQDKSQSPPTHSVVG